MEDVLYVVKEYIGLINQLILFYILSKHRLNIDARKFLFISVFFIAVEYIAVLVLPIPFNYLASVFIGLSIIIFLTRKKLFYKCTIYFLGICIESFAESLNQLFFNITNEFSIEVDIFLKCLTLLILIIILLLLSLRRIKYHSDTQVNFNSFLCISFFVCYALLLIARVYDHTSQNNLIVMIVFVSMLLLLAALSISYLHLKSIEEKKKVEAQFEANKKIVEYQQQYFEEIIESYKQLNSFRHDIEGYIITMEQHILNHDQVSLHELVTLTKKRIDSYKSIKCSNTNIAAIVSYFKVLFDEKGISFKFDYNVPFEINIPADEICTIFYNLLKNAQEATEKLYNVKPEITMNVNSKNNTIIISVSNYVDINIFDMNNLNRMTTSKISSMEHGNGLKNIKVVTDKYGGEISYELIYDKLTIDIILMDVRK